LICLTGGGWSAVKIMRRDARLHSSPNAGWPEAAAAAALGIALSGPRVYNGALTEDPFVHPEGRRELEPEDIEAACALLWRGWIALLGLAALAALI
ncbi:MAG: cobalamin biosynthesis protein, partial [Pseudomonadota bacterium]